MLDLRSATCVELQQSADYDRLVVPAKHTAAGGPKDMRPEQLLAKDVVDVVYAQAMLAALWLWHDDLDASHTIVQQSPADLRRGTGKSSLTILTAAPRGEGDDATRTDTLSLWHAIIHRREGDFGNAKYWYARCRHHPILASLGEQARGTVAHAPADKALLRLSLGDWNGAAFVDLVQQVHESPSDERYAVAVALQQLEWRVLFDFCTRSAAGQ